MLVSNVATVWQTLSNARTRLWCFRSTRVLRWLSVNLLSTLRRRSKLIMLISYMAIGW